MLSFEGNQVLLWALPLEQRRAYRLLVRPVAGLQERRLQWRDPLGLRLSQESTGHRRRRRPL